MRVPRRYRVKWTNAHGETYTFAEAVPADVADQMLFHLAHDFAAYQWVRVWIETTSGEVIDEIKRDFISATI